MKTKRMSLIFSLIFALLVSACSSQSAQSQPEDDRITVVDGETFSTLKANTKIAAAKTKALYIYMTGSNLETKNGAATKNITELLESDISENMEIIIQTGGASKWRKYDIASDQIQRWRVVDHELELLESLPQANMGDPETLAEFMQYCDKNHPADFTGFLFWNHGSGPINGLSFDENFMMDSLNFQELKEAMQQAGPFYDFIGVDACLMATLETADLFDDYAHYLIASQEIVPSGGWDYGALVDAFEQSQTMRDFAIQVCKAYYEKSESSKSADTITLCVLDLSKVDGVKSAFAGFVSNLEDSLTLDLDFYYDIFSAVDHSSKYGGNSLLEGYSNLVDLKSFAGLLSQNSYSAALEQAIGDLVVYSVNGSSNDKAGGLSFYYPLSFSESDLDAYLSLSDLETYNAYLRKLYDSIPEEPIEFIDRGSINSEGQFEIELSADSLRYMKMVDFYLMAIDPDNANEPVLSYGVDNDLFGDFENMVFDSNFKGTWLGLNGKPLYYTKVSNTYEEVKFSAPVIVNGTQTNLWFAFITDDSYDIGGYYEVIGLWDGIGENGVVSRDVRKLVEGDEVTILVEEIDPSTNESSFVESETFTIGAQGASVGEVVLDGRYFQYTFAISDIFGGIHFSDTAIMEMIYSKEELEKNPLQDGKRAADIIAIEDTSQNSLYEQILFNLQNEAY